MPINCFRVLKTIREFSSPSYITARVATELLLQRVWVIALKWNLHCDFCQTLSIGCRNLNFELKRGGEGGPHASLVAVARSRCPYD